MTLIRREGFVSALREGIIWYLSQDGHGPDAATQLAERFAAAVDTTIAKIAERPKLLPVLNFGDRQDIRGYPI